MNTVPVNPYILHTTTNLHSQQHKKHYTDNPAALHTTAQITISQAMLHQCGTNLWSAEPIDHWAEIWTEFRCTNLNCVQLVTFSWTVIFNSSYMWMPRNGQAQWATSLFDLTQVKSTW